MAEIDRVELVRAIVAQGLSVDNTDAKTLLERIDALTAAQPHAGNDQAASRHAMVQAARRLRS